MYCVRVFLLIFLIIFTAAAACSSFFPLMHSEDISAVYPDLFYWVFQKKESNGVIISITQNPTSHLLCKERRFFHIIACICSVAGPALGLIAVIGTSGFLGSRRRNCCCSCLLFFLSFLAFACCGVCVALLVYMYMRPACTDDTLPSAAYKNQGYKLVEGFGLIAAACGGYLISTLLSLCA